MRRIASIAALVLVTATLLGACSSSSTGLTGKTWTLSAVTQDVPAFQGVIPPTDQGKYTITFNEDSTFNAKADCNNVSGGYRTGANGSMAIQPGPSTMAFCGEASLGNAYTSALSQTTSYAISSGTLSLTLSGGGKLQFT
jgi:heat shock protein HslJ